MQATARVTRAYQYTRWHDGSTHLWIERRKGPGRGEGVRGLCFDVAEETGLPAEAAADVDARQVGGALVLCALTAMTTGRSMEPQGVVATA